MAVSKGDKAPLFKLYASDESQVSLEDYQGKNLLVLFFPFAFTGVCTAELCSMRDDITTYNNMSTDVVAISVDSPFTLAKFKEDQNLNFPLLSDFNKEVSTSFGAIYDEFAMGTRGVSKRSAFVIDKDGVVQYAEVLENPTHLPNFEAIKETLSGLN